MKNTTQDNLNRAVSLLNFENENRGKLRKVLSKKYKIPQLYVSMLVHKIFQRLGNYDFTWPPKAYTTLWEQVDQIASEEAKTLNFQ